MLYSLTGSDGAAIWPNLLDVNGTLYGVAGVGGGKQNAGTVFSYSPQHIQI